eukprot:PhF_6_TR36534/c0_g1_i12/m.53868/K16302/CNNM; metal transporter CNNM
MGLTTLAPTIAIFAARAHHRTFHAQNGIISEEGAEPNLGRDIPLTIIFLAISAICTGLNIGVMGLDTINLEIVAESGPMPECKYARKILPYRKKGHQLLATYMVTITLFEVLMEEVLSAMTTGLIGVAISVVLVTIFAEMIPMAVCKSRALYIGAKTIVLTNLLLFVLYPVAKPLGILLDWLVGHDAGDVYDRNELMRLMTMHAEKEAVSGLRSSEVKLMIGAMNFGKKDASQVCTPLHDVFMVSTDDVITQSFLENIWAQGHSRIPVYRGNRENIIGVLYLKDLLSITAKDNYTVDAFLAEYPRDIHIVMNDTKLPVLLNFFLTGRTHMGIVKRIASSQGVNVSQELIGVVTMEDVIEELINEEIYDERDAHHIPLEPIATSGQDGTNVSFRRSSHSHHHKQTISMTSMMQGTFSANRSMATAGYLQRTYPDTFGHLPLEKLMEVVTAHVRDVEVVNPAAALEADWNEETNSLHIQSVGKPIEVFTLVLGGHVQCKVGKYVTDMRSWSVIGEMLVMTRTGLSTSFALTSPMLPPARVKPSPTTTTTATNEPYGTNPTTQTPTAKSLHPPASSTTPPHTFQTAIGAVADYSARVVSTSRLLQFSRPVIEALIHSK